MTLVNIKESVNEDFRQRIDGLKHKFQKRQSEHKKSIGKSNRYNILFSRIVNTKDHLNPGAEA